MNLKYLFLSTILTICLHALGLETHFSSNWKLKDSKTDLKVFIDQNEPMNSITVSWVKTPSPRILNQNNLKSEVQKMQDTRRQVNGLIGLNDWTLLKSALNEKGDFKTLLLEGKYSLEGEPFYFWEHQIYHENNYLQIKVAAKLSHPLSAAELDKIFNAVEIP